MTNKPTQVGTVNYAVVYSFQGRWLETLEGRKVNVFFRKRAPIELPNRVFLYVGVPTKAIIGFSEIISIKKVKLSGAMELKEKASISDEELKSYFRGYEEIYALEIGDPVRFQNWPSLSMLESAIGFYPPQSFSILTREKQQKIIDLSYE